MNPQPSRDPEPTSPSSGADFSAGSGLWRLAAGFAAAVLLFSTLPRDPTEKLSPLLQVHDTWKSLWDLPVQPAPGELRIAVVGDSLTTGYPYVPFGAVSYATLMETGLRAVFPEQPIVVRLAAEIALDSRELVRLCGEVLRYHPQVVCVTLGGNEFATRIVNGTALVPESWGGRVTELLSRGRVLWRALLRPLGGGHKEALAETRLEVVRSGVRAAGHGRPGVGALPVSTADRELLVSSLQDFMEKMAVLAAEGGAQLVFCLSPDNVAGSWPRAVLEADPAIDQLIIDSWSDARELLPRVEALLREHPGCAELHSLRGRLLRSAGHSAPAAAELQESRDLDPAPLHVISLVARGVESKARELGRPFVALNTAFERLSPDGIPDPRWFLDDGHTTAEGHGELALHLARELAARGFLPELPEGWQDRFRSACRARLPVGAQRRPVVRMEQLAASWHMLLGNFRDPIPPLCDVLMHMDATGAEDADFGTWSERLLRCVLELSPRLHSTARTGVPAALLEQFRQQVWSLREAKEGTLLPGEAMEMAEALVPE